MIGCKTNGFGGTNVCEVGFVFLLDIQYAQKFDMHINSTRHFFQNHFNEIPELHSKATIPPVVM